MVGRNKYFCIRIAWMLGLIYPEKVSQFCELFSLPEFRVEIGQQSIPLIFPNILSNELKMIIWISETTVE